MTATAASPEVASLPGDPHRRGGAGVGDRERAGLLVGDDLDLPVDRLRSNLQREFDLDSTARRARLGRLPDPGALVPIDQFGFQHRERAAAILDLAAAGIARSRA